MKKSKFKQIYRSGLNLNEKAHDVVIFQDTEKVNGVKVKMTYESYNAVERFTGETWVGGKWEHTFTMLDLGVEPERSSYSIWDSKKKLMRAEDLISKGIDFLTVLKS